MHTDSIVRDRKDLKLECQKGKKWKERERESLKEVDEDRGGMVMECRRRG